VAAMGGHVAFLQFLSWNNADMNAQVPILWKYPFLQI
jgi:hypothetical protein